MRDTRRITALLGALAALLAAGCEGSTTDTSGAALSLATDEAFTTDASADDEAEAIDGSPIAQPLGGLFSEIAPLRPHCFHVAARCASEGERPFRCASAALHCALPEHHDKVRQATRLCAPPPPKPQDRADAGKSGKSGKPGMDDGCKDAEGGKGPKGKKPPMGGKPGEGQPPMDEQDEAIAAMSPDERQAACQEALEDLIEVAAETKDSDKGPKGEKGLKSCHPCHAGLNECLSLEVGAIGCFVELGECLIDEPLPEPPAKGQGPGEGKQAPKGPPSEA